MAGLSGSQELISNSSHHSLTDNSIGARSLRTAVHLLRFRACRVAATMLFAINAFGAVDCMAAVAPSPTTLSWVAVPVGGIGAQKTVTLTNSNAASITISGVTLSGANAADFKIYSKTCGATLAAAASCTAKIAFAPTTTGARTATLNFKDSAGTQTVSLAGNGTAPSASVSASPTSLTFAAVTVGSSSAAQSVTLSNKLTTSITISSVAISGTNAADFTISSKTCGTSLAASGSCTASVVFKPSAAGTRTATLRFTDSASNSPQSVALSGAGVVTRRRHRQPHIAGLWVDQCGFNRRGPDSHSQERRHIFDNHHQRVYLGHQRRRLLDLEQDMRNQPRYICELHGVDYIQDPRRLGLARQL